MKCCSRLFIEKWKKWNKVHFFNISPWKRNFQWKETLLTLKSQTFVFVKSYFTWSQIHWNIDRFFFSFFVPRVCSFSTAVEIRSYFESEIVAEASVDQNWQFYTKTSVNDHLCPNAKKKKDFLLHIIFNFELLYVVMHCISLHIQYNLYNCAYTYTHRGNLALHVHLHACFWMVGGNQKTPRKPTGRTCKEPPHRQQLELSIDPEDVKGQHYPLCHHAARQGGLFKACVNEILNNAMQLLTTLIWELV